jgi:hypothetical protein
MDQLAPGRRRFEEAIRSILWANRWPFGRKSAKLCALGTSGTYGNDPPEAIQIKPGFGQRVRAARAYAGGITRSELAASIERHFQDEVPPSGTSTTTIKRLEAGETVRGALTDWAHRISVVTNVPEWFLLGDWEGAAAIIRGAPLDYERLSQEADSLQVLAYEAGSVIDRMNELVRAQRTRRGAQEEWFRHALPALLRVDREGGSATRGLPRTTVRMGGQKITLDPSAFPGEPPIIRHPTLLMRFLDEEAPPLRPQEAAAVDEMFSDPEVWLYLSAVVKGPVKVDMDARLRPRGDLPHVADPLRTALEAELEEPRSVPFPTDKLDAAVLARYLKREQLIAEEIAEIRHAILDPEVKRYFEAVADAYGLRAPQDMATLAHEFAQADLTPQSAVDAPLPEHRHRSFKPLTHLLAQRDRDHVEINAELTSSEEALRATIEAELLEEARSRGTVTIAFPEHDEIKDLLDRYMDGDKLSRAETVKLQRGLDDDSTKLGGYLKVIAERYALEMPQNTASVTHEFGLGDPTPPRASDAPSPAPPGDYGRELAKHLPTERDREQQPSQPAPDAQQGSQ